MFGSLFKKKQNPARQRHIQTMQQIKACLLRMKRVYELTSRRPAQASIRELCKTTESILGVLLENPAYTGRLALFAEYYLPETTGIAEQYAARMKTGATQQGRTDFEAKTETFLRQAADSFASILQGLFTAGEEQADVSMEVLLEALKEQGLR